MCVCLCVGFLTERCALCQLTGRDQCCAARRPEQGAGAQPRRSSAHRLLACAARPPACRTAGAPQRPSRLPSSTLPPSPRPSLLSLQVLELEPGNPVADRAVQRLTPVVEERREKLKEEMMGALCVAGVGGRSVLCFHVCARRGFSVCASV